MAALALAETNKWLKDGEMQTKPFGFTHDCEKFDVHLSEFAVWLKKVPEVSERYLFEQFSLPVKLDMEIGTSLGGLVGISRFKGDTDFEQANGDIRMLLDGGKADIADVVGRLENFFKIKSLEVKSEKTKQNSWKDLFSIKGCYFTGMGQSVTSQKAELVLAQ